MAKRVIKYLGTIVPGSDPIATSGTNLFYGNTEARDLIVNPEAALIETADLFAEFAKLDELQAAQRAERVKQRTVTSGSNTNKYTPVESARYYLSFIDPNRASNYNFWIAIGMALKSVSDDLFVDWVDWSAREAGFKSDSDCMSHWGGVNFAKDDPAIALAKLGDWSLQDGRQKKQLTVTNVTAKKSSVNHVESKPTKGLTMNVEMSSVELEDSCKVTDEDRQQFQDLLKQRAETLNLYDVLPLPLARALTDKARSMPVAPEYLFQPFLAIVAGIIGTRAKLALKGGFKVPCILWTGVIGDPGSMKSPALAVVKDPLDYLQSGVKKSYDMDLEDWNEKKRQYEMMSREEKKDAKGLPEAPHMRHFYLDDFTMEALIDVHSQEQNEAGFSILVDELAGLFKGLDQYKSGTKGNSRQILLTLKGGGSLKRTLKSKDVFLTKTAVSISGGIQPKVLKELMKDPDDPDGMWGRFLWAQPPFVKPYWQDAEVDIFETLKSLYSHLDNHQDNVVYSLSAGALARYRPFHDWIADNLLLYSGATQNFLSKMRGTTGTLALVLHILESVYSPVTLEISEDTMNRAIALSMYYFRQVLSMNAENDLEVIPPQLLKIVELSQQIGKVTPRILMRKKWAKDSKQASQLLQQLGEFAIGTLTQSVRGTLEWVATVGQQTILPEQIADNDLGDARHFDTEPQPYIQPTVDMVDNQQNDGDIGDTQDEPEPVIGTPAGALKVGQRVKILTGKQAGTIAKVEGYDPTDGTYHVNRRDYPMSALEVLSK
jgi:hypothetical protein